MKFKKTAALVCAFGILLSTANASILGTENIESSAINIGKGAYLKTNSFYSDQMGVGQQKEYFVEYTPNTELIPAIINDSIYGKINASSMAQNLNAMELHPAMLINSDFFALTTGVPLSHQISERELVVMDSGDMDAIGFNYDGTAFIAPLSLRLTASVNSSDIDIGVVNKVRQPYNIYMYTDKFSDTTKASGNGVNIVIGSLEGSLSIGEKLKGTVESVTFDSGSVPIPKGKVVLSADFKLRDDILNNMYLFGIGDTVEFSLEATGDERWRDARYVLGAWGGVILKDSQFVGKDETAAPRTAIGIKADGTIVFYTLDGRQLGHSYGARLKTLAERLKELGCTDAVNLDGGGSTTIGAVYPGTDSFEVINRPSDGFERKIATFVGLMNTQPATQTAERLFVYPHYGNYLSGATEKFTVYATDINYYKANLPEEPLFISSDGAFSEDGSFKIKGNGDFTVTALSEKLQSSVTVKVYETPTSITVKDAQNSKEINTITLNGTEQIDLNAAANVGNAVLKGDDSCFIWSCSEEIGTIDQNGVFTAADADAAGTIDITAGNYTKQIKTTVKKKPSPYIVINHQEISPGNVVVSFESLTPVTTDSVSVTVDGNEFPAEVAENSISFNFDDGRMHKIQITAINYLGNRTVYGFTVKGDAYPNVFEDIEDYYWAKDYISYMYNQKVIQGTVSDGKKYFMPLKGLSRGEFAVMIANMQKIITDTYKTVELPFDDSDSIPDWCKNHIKAMYSMGIMNGKATEKGLIFDYEGTLTHAEVIAVISRLLPDNTQIKDISYKTEIPNWCKEYFDKLASIGLIDSYVAGSKNPAGTITRGETVRLLYEIY